MKRALMSYCCAILNEILTSGCDYKELWRDVIHDWGQFQLSRLFGREVYKFDLLNNSITTHDIRTYDKLSTLQLVEEMRYPHGEIAGIISISVAFQKIMLLYKWSRM